jgi:hypothetical protein
MLSINVDGDEFYNEEINEFTIVGGFELKLEHSLISLSKWESKFQKPFLSSSDKSPEEILSYVKFMSLDDSVGFEQINQLSQENLEEINAYVESPQSATTFGELPSQKSYRGNEVITAELIYYWLVAFNIPFECESWHLNRLFSLIRICNIKNSSPKKVSRHEAASRNRELNAKRKAELGTKG